MKNATHLRSLLKLSGYTLLWNYTNTLTVHLPKAIKPLCNYSISSYSQLGHLQRSLNKYINILAELPVSRGSTDQRQTVIEQIHANKKFQVVRVMNWQSHSATLTNPLSGAQTMNIEQDQQEIINKTYTSTNSLK